MNPKKLFEYCVSGKVEHVTKCINSGINIYSRTPENETPFYLALKYGHTQVANILWNIYERDLKFIERSSAIDDDEQFWLKNSILIGFGYEQVTMCEKLYSVYQNCERDYAIDKTKRILMLLKHDNFICSKVLSLSPKSEKGRMLTVAMIKCIISNGFLDLNAKTTNHLSMLDAAAQSGLIDMFKKLLSYGAELNKTKIICSALEYGQIGILEELKKIYHFHMYDLLMSQDCNWYIFRNDNWPMFKYIAEQIISETKLSWNNIINLVLLYNSKSLTVFQYAICRNCVEIAENCLPYGPNISNPLEFLYSLEYSNILNMQRDQNLLLKIIEIDPISLLDEDKIGFLHKIVHHSSVQTVKEIYARYPFVNRIFFKNIQLGLSTIIELFQTDEQREKLKCILAHSIDEIDTNTFNQIVSLIAVAKDDDIVLFSYAISLKQFDFTCPAIRNVIPDIVLQCNCHILNIILSNTNYNLSEIPNLLNFDLDQITVKNSKSLRNMFDKLVQCGISYSTVNYDGKNLLHQSVATNNIYVIKKVLELGIGLNVFDRFGKLPIHYTTSVEILHLLNTWTSTSYINVVTKQKRESLLHIAVADNNRDLIKYILEIGGGNINAVNRDGRSPIFYVRDIKTGQLLLEYGPNLNVLDNYGDPPIIYFMSSRRIQDHNHDIVNLLWCNNSKFSYHVEKKCNQNFKNRPFLIEVLNMCNACTKILLSLPNINFFICDDFNSNALHVATAKHDFDLFDKFIEKGLPINALDFLGRTPLIGYCTSGPHITFEGVNRILKYKPDVNFKSKGRQLSAIWCAAQYGNVGAIICELLLRGANIMDTDLIGNTAYSELSSELQKLFKFLT